MNNKFIPEILKEKFSLFYSYTYGAFLLVVSIFFFISLISFDINDNSFLTSTNNITKNLLGPLGAYVSSFVFYTFGVMGYLVASFFLFYSILVFIRKKPRYIFIRLFLFIISLLLLPQSFLHLNFIIPFNSDVALWGIFSNKI